MTPVLTPWFRSETGSGRGAARRKSEKRGVYIQGKEFEQRQRCMWGGKRERKSGQKGNE